MHANAVTLSLESRLILPHCHLSGFITPNCRAFFTGRVNNELELPTGTIPDPRTVDEGLATPLDSNPMRNNTGFFGVDAPFFLSILFARFPFCSHR